MSFQSSTSFSTLSAEYHSTLTSEYIKETSDNQHGLVRTSSYESYDKIYQKIQSTVIETLNNKKNSKMVDESNDSDEETDELSWETSSNTSAKTEVLLDFRPDLTTTEQPIIYNDSNQIETEVHVPEKSVGELEQQFEKELLNSTILADFHERYIVRSLESKREAQEMEMIDIESDLDGMNARKAWMDVMTANPMMMLETLGRSISQSKAAAAYSSSSGDSFRKAESLPISSIDELGDDDDGFTLNESSRKFARFIPQVIPRLNVTEAMINEHQ
ncbi:hypothetical protein HDV02_004312 [Globomyces sp. JEL0801]|nr:hypothetical protein HDV02_004312 [Globomyces sp. JEL0801]